MVCDPPFKFYEFFSGGGMARLGLGKNWQCLFANDHNTNKAKSYIANFGPAHFNAADIGDLSHEDLPGRAHLAWASFPCQDLSLAGKRSGLSGKRSNTFFEFLRLIKELKTSQRAPDILTIENVTGLVTSHKGTDFQLLLTALGEAGYNFGAVEIDAASFLPQSRPRIFIIAVKENKALPAHLIRDAGPLAIPSPFHTPAIRKAIEAFPEEVSARWIWLYLPTPPVRSFQLMSIIEDPPIGITWHRATQTRKYLDMMNERHRSKVTTVEHSDISDVGAFFRRTRLEKGVSHQRTEIRFDGMAGCLRTPGGGSSRQFLMFVKRNDILSRPMSPRETARLMGLPETYKLPVANTTAQHLIGDGVAVPVVRWLAQHILEPLLQTRT
jgi:DNA (cytosine-5)-methyltransferase 1